MEESDYSEFLRRRLWGFGRLWGIKPTKSSCRCSVCCEPEWFQLRSSMLIQLCIQTVCRWYLSTDKSDVQHTDDLFKQGFPLKTHSGFPILATVFFCSASIRAVCVRQPCTGHDFREMEVTELLTAIILWQKHLEIYLAIRRMQPCAFLAAARGTSGLSWANCSGITGYEDRRKWKEKMCFFHWLKSRKLEQSLIRSPWSLREAPAGVTKKEFNLTYPHKSQHLTHKQHVPFPYPKCPNKISQLMKNIAKTFLVSTFFDFVFNKKYQKHLCIPKKKKRSCKNIFSLINMCFESSAPVLILNTDGKKISATITQWGNFQHIPCYPPATPVLKACSQSCAGASRCAW